MKAVQIHRYGGSDVLTYEETERPVPGRGEVLVRVHAVGLNPVDTKTRQGLGIARMLGDHPFPLILGWDISGEIVKLGAGVTAYTVGDAVYVMNRYPQPGNAYAEYVTAPVSDIAKKPANVSHVEAATLPMATLTAWQALFDSARLQPGETVLLLVCLLLDN
ncbi:MAG TPA: NADP-dependent oxidoreductase [Ktedonobacteraceae bacterium]|nr:NADP-dependent oxidoreductase [Ktedonobacteraceae bacterium]